MRVLLVAGEASGDVHAAKVAAALLRDGAEIRAVGGPALEAAGADLVEHIDALAVLGFVEVVSKLPRILTLQRTLERMLEREPFDLFLGVDSPGFNLRLAGRARRRGIPVLHYIGPQIWAWRAHRLQTLRRVTNHVALVLPFEKPLYDAAGVPATFVGHPLLEDAIEGSEAPDCDLGLLPGSRPQEVSRHLPILLRAAAQVQRQRPQLRIRISCAASLPRGPFETAVRRAGFPSDIVDTGPARSLLSRSRASLVASGTATLEAALVGNPFAVFYRMHAVNFAVVRRLVHLPYVSLANLVAETEVVREYLQDAADPETLAREALQLLEDDAERERQRSLLRDVRARLGTPGASGRVAALAHQLAFPRGRTA